MTSVRGFGQQYGHLSAAPSAGSPPLVLPKLRVELVVNDEVVDAIAKAVNTGTIGDGKIWICDVERALRVRTGQRDRDAL